MLTQVVVRGYRLLDEFRADLGQLTVIIGPNGVGKSTLLDFLQFLAQCVDMPLNKVFGWHFGVSSILNAVLQGYVGLDRTKRRNSGLLEKCLDLVLLTKFHLALLCVSPRANPSSTN